jgi:hypothetical protein
MLYTSYKLFLVSLTGVILVACNITFNETPSSSIPKAEALLDLQTMANSMTLFRVRKPADPNEDILMKSAITTLNYEDIGECEWDGTGHTEICTWYEADGITTDTTQFFNIDNTPISMEQLYTDHGQEYEYTIRAKSSFEGPHEVWYSTLSMTTKGLMSSNSGWSNTVGGGNTQVMYSPSGLKLKAKSEFSTRSTFNSFSVTIHTSTKINLEIMDGKYTALLEHRDSQVLNHNDTDDSMSVQEVTLEAPIRDPSGQTIGFIKIANTDSIYIFDSNKTQILKSL